MFWLLLTALTPANAYETMLNPAGSELYWASMPVRYTVDTTGAPDIAEHKQQLAIDASFGVWSGIDGADVHFERVDASDNVVFWDNEWPWDPDLLALTSTWSTEWGEVRGFTVAINGTKEGWTTDRTAGSEAIDLQNAMTHEVGHVLGLDHNTLMADATMFPTTPRGELAKRDLHADDEDGARYLYGAAEASGMACSATSGSGGWAFVFPMFAVLTRTRRRAR